MSWTEKCECSELIQRWGVYRDQARWDDLLETFHHEGTISVSWFSGSAGDFVERARANYDHSRETNITKHQLWPSIVEVNGDRALAETSVAILARQKVRDFYVDNTSHARFLDRLERREGKWKILARSAIYEKDRFDAVDSPEKFARFMRETDFSSVPAAFRYIGYRIIISGRQISPDVHIDGAKETYSLYRDGRRWLEAGQ
jgi:hypothetical protein